MFNTQLAITDITTRTANLKSTDGTISQNALTMLTLAANSISGSSPEAQVRNDADYLRNMCEGAQRAVDHPKGSVPQTEIIESLARVAGHLIKSLTDELVAELSK